MTAIKPTSVAVVNIIETDVFGAVAHHWECTVCSDKSMRRDARRDGEPHAQISDGATRHAAKHTDAQDAIDAAR